MKTFSPGGGGGWSSSLKTLFFLKKKKRKPTSPFLHGDISRGDHTACVLCFFQKGNIYFVAFLFLGSLV